MRDFVNPDTASYALLAEGGGNNTPVFERLAIIVRALHDTLSEIGVKGVLADAASEFPSARDRLRHIASLTENATNTVLGKVEENVPLLDQLASKAASLEEAWRGDAGRASIAPEYALLTPEKKAGWK